LAYISAAESIGVSSTTLRNPPRKLTNSVNYAAVRAITPCKVIQGHRVWYQSKAHMRLHILLVINSNLYHILHRFRDTAFERSKIAIFGYPSCV